MEREKVTASEANAAVRLLCDFVVSSGTARQVPGKKKFSGTFQLWRTHFLPLMSRVEKGNRHWKTFFKWNVELSLCRDKSGRWSLNDIDEFPQVLLLLLNFKVLNWKCSWILCPDCQRVTLTVYSIKRIKVMISTCSIEFLVILNYLAITNIFAANQIMRYNGVVVMGVNSAHKGSRRFPSN